MDITPIWIDGYYDTQAEADSAMRELLINSDIKLEGVATPALTLDQIEEWLKANEYARTANGLHMCIDDLLAQVQAMREGA